jgi:phage portal protein BeeE
MSFRDQLGQFLSLGVAPAPVPDLAPRNVTWRSVPEIIAENKLQTRAIDSYTSYPGLEQQLLAVQGLTDRPWRYPSINEALGVPAIFRAVALIANTTGSLALEAYRRGVKLPDEDIPIVVKRPDPFKIPRDFFRDTAFDLAARGEFWWWVAARDSDGNAMSLIRVPPWEVTVQPTDDRLRPKILWLNREMRREDMRHGTFLPDDTGYRGVGPLQMCGAAMSVAVESQEWAANFYAEGGYPSVLIKSATELGQGVDADATQEADTLRAQWVARDHNTPRVIDPGIESVDIKDVDTASAQALQARDYNNGDARMFGLPGALLEFSAQGSSLTYQNVTEVFTRFVKTPLAPDYLEPIEQHLSDLLPRSTVARFNVGGFLRADVKTRWEVYEIATRVVGLEEAATMAREREGLTPGDIEFAPVPFSPPQAVPERLPVQLRSQPDAVEVRCDGTRMLRGLIKPCNAKLADRGPFTGNCWRCGKTHQAAA